MALKEFFVLIMLACNPNGTCDEVQIGYKAIPPRTYLTMPMCGMDGLRMSTEFEQTYGAAGWSFPSWRCDKRTPETVYPTTVEDGLSPEDAGEPA